MAWLATLADTYDYIKENSKENVLVPPAHVTQNAQVTIVIDQDGKFDRAELIDKENAATICPATISSASRTSGVRSHGLFDNLHYIAGDLRNYLENEKKADKAYEAFHLPYMAKLKSWLESPYSHEYLEPIYTYLSEGKVIGDLVKKGIISLDESGYIDDKKKFQNTAPSKFLVRFAIEYGDELKETWKDFTLFDKYQDYYTNYLKIYPNLDQGDFTESAENEDKGFCYATGDKGPMTSVLGKFIRYPGDGAKIISSNDSSNFTFRGHFDIPDEAFLISYEASEKAHSALRYLIRNQGFTRNGYSLVAWSKGNEIPRPGDSTLKLTQEIAPEDQPAYKMAQLQQEVQAGRRSNNQPMDPNKKDKDEVANLNEDFSNNLARAFLGLRHKFNDNPVNLIALDAATPGRMAIIYYNEKDIDDYLDRLESWHSDLAWVHHYIKDGESGKYLPHMGAPSMTDIIQASFGVERGGLLQVGKDDNYVNQQYRRLFSCLIEGQALPYDFVRAAYNNAINPQKKSTYNWLKCLTVACSLVRKHLIEKGENYTVSLEKENKDRSYLYGRLLALADKAEDIVLSEKQIKRPTAAKNHMSTFASSPYRTWQNIYLKLQPYLRDLNRWQQIYFEKGLQEVHSLFDSQEFASNRALEPKFILAYYSQLKAINDDLYTKKEDKEKKIEEDK